VVCRAVSRPPVPAEDEWARRPRKLHTSLFLDWDELRSRSPAVPYLGQAAELRHAETGTLDLCAVVDSQPEMRVEDLDRQVRLRLEDRY
jgi:hypothetical protein